MPKKKIDNDKLIEMFNAGIVYVDIAKHFNVCIQYVSKTLNKLGYTRAYKPWSKKDVEYLLNKVGSISISRIEQQLNRTHGAIRQKLFILGVTSIIDNSGMISLNKLSIVTHKSGTIIKKWVDDGLLKAKKSNIIKRSHVYLIDIDDFWKFAENNKDKLKFSLIDRNVLLPEPKWVERERIRERNDNNVYYHKNWTNADSEYAMFLYNAGHKYKYIGKKMGRTYRSVIGKIHRMKIRK